MQPAQDPADRPRRRALWRYGPIAVVVLVIAAVVAVSVLGDDESDDTDAETAADPGELPEGVVTWSLAQEEGLDVDWADTCDTSTGRIAIPNGARNDLVTLVIAVVNPFDAGNNEQYGYNLNEHFNYRVRIVSGGSLAPTSTVPW